MQSRGLAPLRMRIAASIAKQLLITGSITGMWIWSYYFLQDHIIYIATTCAIVLYAAMWGFSIVAAVAVTRFGIDRDRLSEPVSSRVDSPIKIPLFLQWVKFVPFVRVRSTWVTISGCEVYIQGNRERIRSARRAYVSDLVRVLTFTDVFGLSEVWMRVRSSSRVRILPARSVVRTAFGLGAVNHVDADAAARGKPVGDFLEMRSYRRGESMRRVLWKLVARRPDAPREQWMVRSPEPAVGRACGVFLVPSEADEVAAELALAIVEQSLLGKQWIFGGAVGASFGSDAAVSIGDRLKASDIVAGTGNAPSPTNYNIVSQLKIFNSVLGKAGVENCYVLVGALNDDQLVGSHGFLQSIFRHVSAKTHVVVAVRNQGDAAATIRLVEGFSMKSVSEAVVVRTPVYL